VVEREPAWSWPCEQLKFSQQRRRNHRVDDSELRSTNHCVSLGLLSTLPSSSIVLSRYILWCALLLYGYCVYPYLNISRSSLHIFWELNCLLREISLNSLIPVEGNQIEINLSMDLSPLHAEQSMFCVFRYSVSLGPRNPLCCLWCLDLDLLSWQQRCL
jgi:hypothetical protein